MSEKAKGMREAARIVRERAAHRRRMSDDTWSRNFEADELEEAANDIEAMAWREEHLLAPLEAAHG